MKFLVVFAACFVLASSMTWRDYLKHYLENLQRDYTLDFIHSYRFEEHDKMKQHVLVAINNRRNEKSCHVVEMTEELVKYLQTREAIEKVTEDIYGQIKNQRANEKEVTGQELDDGFHDSRLNRECYGYKKYVLRYEPSFKIPGVNTNSTETF